MSRCHLAPALTMLLASVLLAAPSAPHAGSSWSAYERVIEQRLNNPGLRPEKLAEVLPEELRDTAWAIGVEAGLAQHCGLDWRAERTAPMMAVAKQSGRLDRTQLQALETWSGVAQRGARQAVASIGPCTDELLHWLRDVAWAARPWSPSPG